VTFCPADYISRDELELIDMAKLIKKGVLPREGGYLNQPWKLMQLIQITSSEVATEERRSMGMLFPLFQLIG